MNRFCSEMDIFLLTLAFSLGSRGILIVLELKLYKTCSLPCGGTKVDLFLTKDSSSSSQPSKKTLLGELYV